MSIEFDAHLGKTTRVEGGTYRRDWCRVREDSNRALRQGLEVRPVEFRIRKAAVPRHHLRTKAGYIDEI